MQRVAVVGGGIIGAMAAAELARGGAEVTLWAGRAPRASDASLAWLNVSSAADPDYAALRRESLELWHRLAAEEGAPVRWPGALLWEDGLDAEAEAARLSALGWPAEAIGAADFARLAPGVAAPPERALWVPREGAGDPAGIMGWAERRAGGARRVAAEVEALEMRGGRVSGLRAQGERHAFDAVLVAAGTGSAPLLAGVGFEVRLRDAPGMLMRTGPVPPVAGPVMASPVCDFWQAPDGRIFAATDWHKVLAGAAEEEARAALERLGGLMPDIGRPRIERVLERNRPLPADGFPLAGAALPGCWLCVTHSGMTLAPVLARALAQEILQGRAAPELARWSPRRDIGER